MELYQSHRYRITVAADDFGISQKANKNILRLISLGKIDRVGIMAFGEISTEEINELVKSEVKLDIHLDILHELGEKRSQRTSAIWRGVKFILKIITGKITRKKVEADWNLQIDEFIRIFGKKPDGINSHEHVHFFPLFFQIALKLQRKYSIPYIRFGESVSLKHHTIVAHILHILRIIDKKYFLSSAAASSKNLVSMDWIEDPEKFINNPPDDTIEIACHPESAEDFAKIKNYF